MNLEKLKDYFPPHEVQWRVGTVSKDGTKAMALAYIDARMVMDRLDEVCGVDGWQDHYDMGATTLCTISIHTDRGWVGKSDGAGTTQVEAEKGQLSDAFKRAAVKWGIGRYLYELKSPWVTLDQYKHIQPHELERLAGLLPNSHKDQVKVVGLTGIAKETGKFWSQSKLLIPLSAVYVAEAAKNGGNWSDDAKKKWFSDFMAGINKAPSIELLSKFEADNKHIIEGILDRNHRDQINESCQIRSQQFIKEGKQAS